MAYEKVNWENLPSTNTPVNATNLNKMDEGINNIQALLVDEDWKNLNEDYGCYYKMIGKQVFIRAVSKKM